MERGAAAKVVNGPSVRALYTPPTQNQARQQTCAHTTLWEQRHENPGGDEVHTI